MHVAVGAYAADEGVDDVDASLLVELRQGALDLVARQGLQQSSALRSERRNLRPTLGPALEHLSKSVFSALESLLFVALPVLVLPASVGFEDAACRGTPLPWSAGPRAAEVDAFGGIAANGCPTVDRLLTPAVPTGLPLRLRECRGWESSTATADGSALVDAARGSCPAGPARRGPAQTVIADHFADRPVPEGGHIFVLLWLDPLTQE